MKRYLPALLAASLFFTLFSPITSNAVSSNPSPVCAAGTCTITFTYTGDYYQWSAPSAGSYTLEVWGAQGGGTGANYWGTGGNGGYSKGNLTLTNGQTLYIYPGQQGFQSATVNAFNGGGKANAGSTYGNGWTGGGATHIATSVGQLSTLSGNTSAVKIVAGGGGGAGGSQGNPGYNIYFANGGAGGGSSGLAGANSYNDTSYRAGGGGGTQVSGGTSVASDVASGFGRGADAQALDSDAIQGGGGGGGWYGGGAGTQAGGGGGGGSGYVGGVTASTITAGNSTMPNPSGGTMTGRTGNGIARITYDNTISATTFSTSQTSPTNIGTGSTVSYSLVLSQSVSDLTASDFQFGGTSTCNTPELSGSTTTYTVTVTNCTEGTLILQLKANSVTGSSPGPASISSANTVIIDRTGPTVASVTAPANKTYIPTETPTFTVNFSESVTATGTPRLILTVGLAATKFAYYVSMTDSKTALFRYTVGTTANEYDTDGILVTGAISQIAGSFSDLAGNAMSSALFTPPTLTSVLVAQPASAPSISSITATTTQLSVAFSSGATNGSTTSSYQYSTNNGSTWNNRASGTTASPLVITGLVDGTGYTVRLRAVTNAGFSDSSTAVTETPTAVAVTGDSILILTYGSSASTSAYAATGGTGTYTWSLGSTLTGITLSGTTVTAGATTPAGTYSQTVRATDGNSQVGTRSLTITVNKASTSITIALPNSASNAALGGVVTITATVPRAGAVNFRLGGSTISGCGSAAAATTTATCSWTPNALGSVSLTAIFTPSDTSNFETSTSTTLSITVVNGVSTVTLSLAGGTTTPPKGQAINIIAAVDQAGRITFLIDGKRIPGCFNKSASVGNVTCSWKPAVQKAVTISARLVPTNNVFNPSTSSLAVQVIRRTGPRG